MGLRKDGDLGDGGSVQGVVILSLQVVDLSAFLEQLKNGDIVYSKRLDVQATVLGYKHFNGFMHYRLKYERIGSEPIEKLISPAGLEIEGFEKSA